MSRHAETGWILAAFAELRSDAQTAYRRFVTEGRHQPSPWQKLKNQIYLGSDGFVEEMQSKVAGIKRLSEIPKTQRKPVAKPISWFFEHFNDRDTAIMEAFQTGTYTMRAIGDHAGLHYSTISRIITCADNEARNKT